MAVAVANSERMSHWSVWEPSVTFSGNVDHWTKLRSQANGQSNQAPMAASPSQGTLKFPPVPGAQYGDGRVDPVANSIAHQVNIRDLHGNIPGNYSSPYQSMSSRSRSSPRSSSSRSNVYSARAKEGHKFWYQERPKPTSYGSYGLGARSTNLGLQGCI